MKIKATSANKVNGKLIKYKRGDCLSINCNNGKYIGVFISEKFNNYYDLTLIEYYEDHKPVLPHFIDGRFWGTRSGTWESLVYTVDKKMALCSYIDNHKDIEIVGELPLIKNLEKASYSYINDITALHDYYVDGITIRVEKTQNAEKYPDLAFMSKHLIPIKSIINL